MKITTRKLIFAAMLIALMAVLQMLNLGIIYIFAVPVTVLHIPVIIGTIVGGLGVGIVLGGTFGVLSVINAIIRPTPLSPLFYNPLVSIVPRLLIPVITCVVFMALRRMEEKHLNLRIIITAIAGSLTNTVFVLGALILLYGSEVAAAYKMQIGAVVGWAFGISATNGLPEAAVCAFLTLIIIKALSKTRQYKELKGNDL